MRRRHVFGPGYRTLHLFIFIFFEAGGSEIWGGARGRVELGGASLTALDDMMMMRNVMCLVEVSKAEQWEIGRVVPCNSVDCFSIER